MTENNTEAVRWLRAAAEQGHAKAQFYLGTMYDTGKGTAKSDVDAYLWISLAKAGGEKEAADALDALNQRMAEAQITEAKARFEGLKESLLRQ